MPVLNQQQFEEILREKLGDFFERALIVFQNWGPRLSYDVINVLLHAADQDKTEEVLSMLEEHWTEHLHFQHPDIRGSVTDDFDVNHTQELLLNICQGTLGLQPTTP